MAFDDLAARIHDLGGIKPVGEGPAAFPEARLRALERQLGGAVPPALTWFWTAYGGGVEFVAPIVYVDPRANEPTLLGWFLTPDEIVEALSETEGALAVERIPFINDGGDNLLVIDRDGGVWEHVHDAPTDRNAYRVADSFEAFVRALELGA